jgi:head-tail adaptor
VTTNNKLRRDKVAFDQRAPVDPTAPAGAVQGDWVEQFQEQCNIKWMRGSEQVLAQRLQGINPIVISVRSSALTRQVDATWRARLVRQGNKPLSIRSVIPDQRDFYLEILCEAGVSPG